MIRIATAAIVSIVITATFLDTAMALPLTPTARSCVVDPIDEVDLMIAAAGPVPRRADAVVSSEAVTDVELARITRIVRILTACANANQPMRSLALVTDTYIAEFFAGPAGQDQLGHLIAVSSRAPEPAALEDRLTLVTIESAVRYEDGRIAVTVVTVNSDSQFTDLMIFLETDNGWRLNQVVLGEVVAVDGTPVP